MKNPFLCYFFLTLVLLAGCKSNKEIPLSYNNDPLFAKAEDLCQKYIITDGHVDLPYRLEIQNFRLEREYLGIPIQTDKGDFDHVRAVKGGLNIPFMSIYLPAAKQKEAGASKALADRLIDMVSGICDAHPNHFRLIHTVDGAEQAFKDGVVGLPMGMENGSGIEDDLKNVKYFKDRGINYITLTHSKVNNISDSSYDTSRVWGGLSPFGMDVVKEMNRVGIMVDISHVSDEAFYDVMEITEAPVIASHSSCRAFTPEFERNMSDDMIKALGENGGVIQINFGSSFLDGEIRESYAKSRTALRKLLEEKGLKDDDDAAKPVIETFKKNNPNLYSDVERVADHIDHVKRLAGVDHIGLGSDFDGVGDSLPTGLKDVSQYPNLVYVLLKRGYTDQEIEKICSKNLFRVWRAVEEYAKKG